MNFNLSPDRYNVNGQPQEARQVGMPRIAQLTTQTSRSKVRFMWLADLGQSRSELAGVLNVAAFVVFVFPPVLEQVM
jgi:hypothetical protein